MIRPRSQKSSTACQRNKQSHLGGSGTRINQKDSSKVPLRFFALWRHTSPPPQGAKIEHLIAERAAGWKKWKNWWVASVGPTVASPWRMPGAIRLNRWSGSAGGGGWRVHDEYSNLVRHCCLTLDSFFIFFFPSHSRFTALCAREEGGCRQPLKVIASYCSGASDVHFRSLGCKVDRRSARGHRGAGKDPVSHPQTCSEILK